MSFLIRVLGRSRSSCHILLQSSKVLKLQVTNKFAPASSYFFHKDQNPPTFQLTSRHLSQDLKSPTEKANVTKENIYTIPNFLCVGRILSAPLLAHLICQTENYPMALALFGVAGVTDALDGWIARNFKGQSSMLGSFLDPLADKILVATLYLSLTYVHLIPIALTSLVVSRDIFLVYAGLHIRYMGVVPPFTFKKYFDVSTPTAQVNPTTVSKLNTAFQLGLVASALATPVLGLVGHPAFNTFCFLTAGTTLASAVSYAFQKDCYKFTTRAHDDQMGKRLFAFVVFLLFNGWFAYSTFKDYNNSKHENKLLDENSLE